MYETEYILTWKLKKTKTVLYVHVYSDNVSSNLIKLHKYHGTFGLLRLTWIHIAKHKNRDYCVVCVVCRCIFILQTRHDGLLLSNYFYRCQQASGQIYHWSNKQHTLTVLLNPVIHL